MSPAQRSSKATPTAASPAPETIFSVERWSATSGNDRPSRASLRLVGGGRTWQGHATGNGAVDALMRAVDEAIARVLSEPVELLTYNVHATGHGHAAAAAVTLSIREFGAGRGAPAYPGRATFENVLEASLTAYLDAINGLLVDRGVDVAALAPAHTRRHQPATDHETRRHARDSMMGIYND